MHFVELCIISHTIHQQVTNSDNIPSIRQFKKDKKVLVTADAQLNEEHFAKTKLGLDFKDDADGFHYGVKAELELPASTYTVTTGVRREESNAHLRVSTSTSLGRYNISHSNVTTGFIENKV